MKRILAILLVAGMAISFSACNNDEPNTPESGGNASAENSSVVSTEKKEDKPSNTFSAENVKKAKETEASLFEYVDVDGGISITRFNGEDEIVVIPSAIDGKNVVTVGENAFVNNSTMKGVKVPDTVHTLETSSFMNCTALEVFVSGASVKKLEMYTLNGCKKLHDIQLNDGLETLDGLCFALTNLTEIEIPSSVTEINYPFTVNYDDHYITVIAESGSAAEQYVNEKGEEYHLIFQAK